MNSIPCYYLRLATVVHHNFYLYQPILPCSVLPECRVTCNCQLLRYLHLDIDLNVSILDIALHCSLLQEMYEMLHY